MKPQKIVVALGGNALGKSVEEQKALVAKTAVPIVDLIEAGCDVIVAHGNGPQVGMIRLAFEKSSDQPVPFAECGAMSQGYIGYHLQNALRNELVRRGLSKAVGTVVTQVEVDEKDPAFADPSKPIGSFYSEAEAEQLRKANPDWVMKEDAGRGWRRVVPSPKPVDIVEKELISDLVKAGHLVIATGGGGIPVVRREGKLVGVDAVIDKDFASAKLAELVQADKLIILTAVEKVAINFGKPEEKGLGRETVSAMEAYAAEGMFAKGSMLPKVQAAISFVKSGKGHEALITSLEKAKEGMEGKTGTTIVEG